MTKPYESSFKMRSITTAATMKEIATEMKVTAAIKKREEWMSDGNKWDTITPGRVPPTGIKYMVVDVETHDWKDGGGSRDGRIVEIAWMVFDRDMKCLESKQYLLKPHGYDKIAQKATSVHGITTECAVENGVESDLVFNEFAAIVSQLPDNGSVIAHCMGHEDSIFKCNLNKEQQNLWSDAPKCDTWNIKLLKYLPSSAREKYKTRTLGINLVELYSVVHPKDNDIEFSHTALVDVKMTWAVFLYYMTNVNSYNELQWKEDYPRYMIPGYKIHARSEQKRKFNQK